MNWTWSVAVTASPASTDFRACGLATVGLQSGKEDNVVKQFSRSRASGPMHGDPGGIESKQRRMGGIDVDQLRAREIAIGFSIGIGCYMSIREVGGET